MDRDEFLTATEIAFERLMTPTRGIRPLRMEEPMAAGRWSLKDLAAHFAHWNTLAVRALEEVNQGRAFDWSPYADEAAQNAEAVERRRTHTLKQVMNELRISHMALMEAVRRVPEERLYETGEIPRWLEVATLDHYAHHTPAVEAWALQMRREGEAGGLALPVKES